MINCNQIIQSQIVNILQYLKNVVKNYFLINEKLIIIKDIILI